MEFALLLIVLVIAEMALSVWFLSRQKYYLTQINALVGEVAGLEHDVTVMGEKLGYGPRNVSEGDKTASDSVSSLLSQATEDDLKQAADILKALGLDKD